MILSGYGIRLEPLTEETAEQLRIWRNSPRILSQMEYREVISSESQQEWFKAIRDNEAFIYWIIYVNAVPIGMIHLSHIDRNSNHAEAGLFIGDDRFSGTGVALGASILLLDYAFGELGLSHIFAKVKAGNDVAEKYNSMLGFVEFQKLSSGFNRWILKAENYQQLKNSLVKLLVK